MLYITKKLNSKINVKRTVVIFKVNIHPK